MELQIANHIVDRFESGQQLKHVFNSTQWWIWWMGIGSVFFEVEHKSWFDWKGFPSIDYTVHNLQEREEGEMVDSEPVTQ